MRAEYRAGPRRSEDGVGGGGIDCQRHVSSGLAARGGEYERGFSSNKGVRGPPPGNF